jgi:hypothetical protein
MIAVNLEHLRSMICVKSDSQAPPERMAYAAERLGRRFGDC